MTSKTNEPNSDPYVINLEHKYFCKIHTIGKEPFKDCLDEYQNIRRKMYKKKKEKKKSAYGHNKKSAFKTKKKKKIGKSETS